MGDRRPGRGETTPAGAEGPSARGRLDSWKEIAAHLRRDERTVRRWEELGLPVHRHLHRKRSAVYAYPDEIDGWWEQAGSRADTVPGPYAGAPGPVSAGADDALSSVAEAPATSNLHTRSGARPRRRLFIGAVAAAVGAAALVTFLLAIPGGESARPEVRSMAVLPLVSLSSDAGQEYFADGMTDALITELARVPGLSVVSRGSVLRLKRTQKTTPEIARELGVDALVEGTVQRDRGTVKVTAQLIHGRSDRHLWAESYERELGDVLRLQGEVARAVAEAIMGRLPREAQARFSHRTVVPEAHDAFLRGRFFWGRRSEEALARGMASLERAIAIDPAYAPAWAALADCYLYVRRRPLDVLPRARDAALRAISLDPGLAEGHVALGNVRLQLDWRGAEEELARAIELNPSSVEAHHQRSHLLIARGRFEESLRESERALALDPLSLSINGHLAFHLMYARDHAASVRRAERTLELDGRYGQAELFRGYALLFAGRSDEALSAFRRASELDPENLSAVAAIARAQAASGRRREARATLERVLAERDHRYVQETDVAAVHLLLGDVDQAFAFLDRALEERDGGAPYLAVDPSYDRIRSTDRFQALLRRMGLP